MAEAQSDKSVKTIRELLGFIPESFSTGAAEARGAAAPDLPIAEEIPGPAELAVSAEEKPVAMTFAIKEPKASRTRRVLTKDLVRYPLIFSVALGFFYLILNFPSVWKQVVGLFDRPEASVKDPIPSGFNLAAYQKSNSKYYVFLNDPQQLAPTEDPDGDGLINSQEFRLQTNPLEADTDWDGYDDGREIMNGYNPLYEGRLTSKQQIVVNESIDLAAIASRKQLQNVSGETIVPRASPSPGGVTRAFLPVVPKFQIDVTKPGNLSIPKLGIDVQIIWSQTFERMEDDLKFGVAHHPDTPYPGELGTASIHGHSSGNPWDGSFKTIFTKLNFLEIGDEVFVTIYGSDGGIRKYYFMVRREQVYGKTDKAQFDAGNGYFLNLSTSWPVGTARQRYVVTTELVGLQ